MRNDRLIIKHLKAREVGYYVGSEAGVPHPDASLARVVVCLNGPAKLMPWTSNKTGVNYSHPVFRSIQPHIVQLISHFSSLSRRLKHQWNTDVSGRWTGAVVEIEVDATPEAQRVHLLPLPKVNKTRTEQLIGRNKNSIEKMPWTLGLVESVAALDVVMRQRFQTGNRIALILLDSNFEIALKGISCIALTYFLHLSSIRPCRIFSRIETT